MLYLNLIFNVIMVLKGCATWLSLFSWCSSHNKWMKKNRFMQSNFFFAIQLFTQCGTGFFAILVLKWSRRERCHGAQWSWSAVYFGTMEQWIEKVGYSPICVNTPVHQNTNPLHSLEGSVSPLCVISRCCSMRFLAHDKTGTSGS